MSSHMLRDQLLAVGLREYDGVFAGGDTANNKLELDYASLSHHPHLLDRVTQGLCEAVDTIGAQPEFVVGVPNGATRLAEQVALRIGVDVYNPFLKKDGNEISYATQVDREMVQNLERGIVVEDVVNTLHTTRQTLRHLGGRATAVVCVFDRGNTAARPPIDVPLVSLVAEYIPAYLPQPSSLWQYAGAEIT